MKNLDYERDTLTQAMQVLYNSKSTRGDLLSALRNVIALAQANLVYADRAKRIISVIEEISGDIAEEKISIRE